jgi:hypothetical protein
MEQGGPQSPSIHSRARSSPSATSKRNSEGEDKDKDEDEDEDENEVDEDEDKVESDADTDIEAYSVESNKRDWEDTPLNSHVWIRRMVRNWKAFVNPKFIKEIFLQYKPHEVLKMNSFGLISDIISMYSPRKQLHSIHEYKYCHLVSSAGYLRRIELRQRRKIDDHQKFCYWPRFCRFSYRDPHNPYNSLNRKSKL